jgi:hypothetical protein
MMKSDDIDGDHINEEPAARGRSDAVGDGRPAN